MAIQTIKATIQMRKGAEQNFDPSQMTAGEWAVSTDSKKVWMCFAPGIVRRMSTYEAFEQDMREIQLILATCQNIQAAVERFMQLAQQHSTQAEEWSVTSKSWAVGGTGTREGENTNNSQFWSNQSKAEADRAKEEADRAAAIANFNIDSELSETSVNPVQNKVITNFLANLKSVAFTGKYSDLTEKLPLINNYLTTEEGVGAADAKLAADLKNQINEINGNLGKKYIANSEIVSCVNGNSVASGARLVVPAGAYAVSAYAVWNNGVNNLNGSRRISILRGDFYDSEIVAANDTAGCRSAQIQSCCGLFISSGNNVLRIFLLQNNVSSAEITAKNIKLLAVKIK